MALYTDIYRNIERHVEDMFRSHHPAHLLLHNLDHTREVVSRANEIAGHYNLSEEDTLALYAAAWFHDTGYLFSGRPDHEEKGVELLHEFLAPYHLEQEIIDKASTCIMATKFPRHPLTLLQEIICDADTYHFGDRDLFKEKNRAAFAEAKHEYGAAINKAEFNERTRELLEAHTYYTGYCKEKLNGEKKKVMKKLKERSKKFADEGFNEAPAITEKHGTTKGMQTMLRLTSANHIQLSEIADQKANILLSVNAIIISVILSVLLRKLQTDPYLTIPTMIFLGFSVITIVIAILSTRPKVNEGRFEAVDVEAKKTNLLFFGNFHKMQAVDYENAMRTMMKDSDYLYSSMIQDIFHLGQVLGKKYRLVRIAYNVFMIGIVLSVIAFILATTLVEPTAENTIQNTGGSPF